MLTSESIEELALQYTLIFFIRFLISDGLKDFFDVVHILSINENDFIRF